MGARMRLLFVLFLWLALVQLGTAEEPNPPPTSIGFNDSVKLPDHALFDYMARQFRWRLKDLNAAPISGDAGEMMLEFGQGIVELETRCHRLSGAWRATGQVLEWELKDNPRAITTACAESADETAVIKAFQSGQFQAAIVGNVKLLLGNRDGSTMRFNAVDRPPVVSEQ